MKEETQLPPKMWGNTIIGFGKYRYKYKSGREGEHMRIGFSPRKQNLTLYLMDGMMNKNAYADDMKQLGKYTTGKSCLYIKRLEQIDLEVLRNIIRKSFHNFTKMIEETDGWSVLA